MIPTKNILQKTFLIRQGQSLGTAFAIEYRGREYLVTARHVVSDTNASVDVLHEESWTPLPVTGLFHHTGEPDVAAITLSRQIAPRLPMELTSSGARIGQNTIFAGFPFGWDDNNFQLNDGYPIPFVKAALLSAFIRKNDAFVIYLDGHNNAGFSGGPIAADRIPDEDSALGPKIIGIVSAFHPENTPHPSKLDPQPKFVDGHPLADDHVHLTNSGFVIGYGITHAIDIVKDNPKGFEFSN